MVDGGYFTKRIVVRPEWLNAAGVSEICSVSHCISAAPAEWINAWRHNDLGWFNRASDALSVVPSDSQREWRLFAYRVYPKVFRAGAQYDLALPGDVQPDPIPPTFKSRGFDCVNKSIEKSLGFECSPLSCNSMATEVVVNRYCLLDSIESAIAVAVRFSIEQPEPGDYYVVQVLEQTAGVS